VTGGMVVNTSRLFENIYLIDTGGFGLRNAISIVAIEGDKGVLLDSGTASTSKRVVSTLAELGIAPSRIHYVMPSHRHFDHAGGAVPLLRLFPKASIAGHEYLVKYLVDPSKINAGAIEAFESYADPMLPLEDDRKYSVVKNGDVIDLGRGLELEIISSPGHTSDHLSFYERNSRLMFCGDSAGSFEYPSKIVTPASFPPSFRYHEYVSSIEKMLTYDIRILCFTHFGAILGEEAKETLRRALEVSVKWRDFVQELQRENRTEESIVKVLREQHIGELRIFPRSVKDKVAYLLAYGFLMGLRDTAS